jgi:hypothetical protein
MGMDMGTGIEPGFPVTGRKDGLPMGGKKFGFQATGDIDIRGNNI